MRKLLFAIILVLPLLILNGCINGGPPEGGTHMPKPIGKVLPPAQWLDFCKRHPKQCN